MILGLSTAVVCLLLLLFSLSCDTVLGVLLLLLLLFWLVSVCVVRPLCAVITSGSGLSGSAADAFLQRYTAKTYFKQLVGLSPVCCWRGLLPTTGHFWQVGGPFFQGKVCCPAETEAAIRQVNQESAARRADMREEHGRELTLAEMESCALAAESSCGFMPRE